MRHTAFRIALSTTSLIATICGTSLSAEDLPRPDNFVFWKASEISAGNRHMADLFTSESVAIGSRTVPLPQGNTLDVTYQQNGTAKTTDDFMREGKVAGLLVLHRGKIVLERYGEGQAAKDYWTSNSVAKSFTSTLVGAAIKDGAIGSVDDLMSKYVPELAEGSFAGVTIRDTLRMASGVRWSEDYSDRSSDSSVIRNLAYPGSTLPPVDIVKYMATRPRVTKPGTEFLYDSGNSHLLGVVLERATGKTLPQYLSEKIWIPAGMEAPASVIKDRSGRPMASCCLNATLRDFGRFGLFMLNGAKDANGVSVVPDGWIEQATNPALPTRMPGISYGYQWWVEANGAYRAIGIFGQMIRIDPKSETIIVALSAWPSATWQEGYANQAAFLDGVMRAINGER